MPNLEWNSSVWDGTYDWSERGEEWSSLWGGSVPQWFGSLYPRVARFLPAEHVLEIAPGFGRWTKFLISAARQLTAVDLSQECVDYCRATFPGSERRFVKNDGKSLEAVADDSIDFAFSFDSLVHVEMDVLDAYLPQLVRKLKPAGVAFVHHSNWRTCGATEANTHFRAQSVSAQDVARCIRDAAGEPLLQELLNWGHSSLTDCLTLFRRRPGGAPPGQPHPVLENHRFMDEALRIKQFQGPYWQIGRR